MHISLYNKKIPHILKCTFNKTVEHIQATGESSSKYLKRHITACWTISNRILLLLLHPFNGLFSRTTWVNRHQKGKTSLDLNGARDDGVSGCSGISCTICKQSAPRCRQKTTPTPHRSIFTGRMFFLMPNQQCQSTEGKDQHTG